MVDNGHRDREQDGPSLGRYMETRLNLLNEMIKAIETRLQEKITEADRRYEQRFSAQMEAILKSDTAMEKRFESVNEFRKMVSDQANLYIPRGEVDRQFEAVSEKVKATNDRLETMEKRLNLSQGATEGGKAVTEDRRDSFNAVWAVVASIAAVLVSIAALFVRKGP